MIFQHPIPVDSCRNGRSTGKYCLSLALSVDYFFDEIDREEALNVNFAEGVKQKIENDDDDLVCSKE